MFELDICAAARLEKAGSPRRRMPASVVAGLLGVCLTACGSAAKRAPEIPFPYGAAPVHGYIRGDLDGDDHPAEVSDRDDSSIRGYGHPASAIDKRMVTGLLKRYYAAAAAADSATACSLTSAGLAKSVNLVDAAPEDYEPSPGTPSLRGKSCVAVISMLAKERHEELAADIDTLVLTGMRVHDSHALAFLGFRTTGERVIPLERERGVWKVDGLFDGGIL